MKRETTRLPKFKQLKSELQRPDYQVVGVLELLWELTAAFHEDGAIGRWSNAAIAAAIEWDGDAGNLVRAMVSTGWLDEVEDLSARLVVHDWYTHVYPGQWDRIRKRVQRAILAGRAPAWQVTMFEKARSERSARSDESGSETPEPDDQPERLAASGSVRVRPGASPPSLVLSLSSPSPHLTSPPPAACECEDDSDGEKIETVAVGDIAFTLPDGLRWYLHEAELAVLSASPAYAGKVDVVGCLRDLARRQEHEKRLRKPAEEMHGYIENWLGMELTKFRKFTVQGTGATKAQSSTKRGKAANGVEDRALAFLNGRECA